MIGACKAKNNSKTGGYERAGNIAEAFAAHHRHESK